MFIDLFRITLNHKRLHGSKAIQTLGAALMDRGRIRIFRTNRDD